MSPAIDRLEESVVIVGMSCRFPGARDPDEFWRNLCAGVESLSEFNDEELLASGVNPAWLRNPDYVRRGMILDDIDRFDAEFFGLIAGEAALLDPQQRLFLECAWEALESAGHPPGGFPGRIGVFAGARLSEYLLNQPAPDLIGRRDRAPLEDFQRLLANDKDFLATRAAYILDLRGPAITVQTACSTSLVAVHLACQSLLNRECDLALAGGASVRVPQKAGYLHSEGMIFSPDGHTRPFDARAGGTVFGSGVGAVALRRLDDALTDGDDIFAIIRGSAVNNDGADRKAAFTAPSPAGQAQVIAEAMAVAGVDPATISYIEAHGTATPLGDSIEQAALDEAFRTRPATAEPCALGSVKANLGHLVHAAGVAGLIKAALMLRRRMLVPSLNYREQDPHADRPPSRFRVNTKLRAWDSGPTPRRAGVSSFGFGGTNAHVVLEEPSACPPALAAPATIQVLPLSARSPEALKDLVSRYAALLQAESPDSCPRDIAWTAQVGRTHFPERLAVVAPTAGSIHDRLASFVAGTIADGLTAGRASSEPLRVAFLFANAGAEYAGMGQELYATQPVFQEALERCADLLGPSLDRPLSDILFGPDAGRWLAHSVYQQPALLALQVGLVSLWRSWGVEADIVLGHGSGELAAAWAAGGLSLENALDLAVERGFRPGWAVAQHESARVGRHRAIAAYPVGRATVTPPRRRFFSTHTGGLVQAEDVADPAYRQHMIETPLQLGSALRALGSLGCDAIVEIGPELVLSGPGRSYLPKYRGPWLASLSRQPHPVPPMYQALAELYVRGADVDWRGIHGRASSRRRVQLPTYPFQRQRHWIAPAAFAPAPPAQAGETARDAAAGHPLLGRRVASPLKAIQFEVDLCADSAPFLRDHWIDGERPLLLAGFLEMLRAAWVEAEGRPGDLIALENLVVHRPCLLASHAPTRLQTILQPGDHGTTTAQIFSAPNSGTGPWTLHVSARVQPVLTRVPARSLNLGAIRDGCPESSTGAEFYGARHTPGTDHGLFELVRKVWHKAGEVLAEVRLPDDGDPATAAFGAHPALVNACLQFDEMLMGCEQSDPFLPSAIEQARFHDVLPARVWCHAVERPGGSSNSQTEDILVCDDAGLVLLEMTGVSFLRAKAGSLRPAIPARDVTSALHEIVWERAASARPSAAAPLHGLWLILADQAGLGEQLARRIEAGGGVCVTARAATVRGPGNGKDFELDPGRPESFRTLVDHVGRLAGDALPLREVVYLWGLDVAPGEANTEQGKLLACGSAFHLVQAVLAAPGGPRDTPGPATRFSIVTRGAQATGVVEGPMAPTQALLWGLGRVLIRERPDLGVRLLDLDPAAAGPDDVQAMLAVLAGTDQEEQSALRGQDRLEPRLRQVKVRAERQPAPAPLVRPDATYLIAGGHGAVGMHVARWLIARGARVLLLLGRRPPSDAVAEELRTWAANGVMARSLHADVTQYDALERAMTEVAAALPPVRGVVHTAGVIDDGTVPRLSYERVLRVLAPKIDGAWNLHRLTRDQPLDFFVVMSSIASLWGPPGRASYAAANAVLDQFVAFRRRLGLPAVGLNYGPLSGGGMATTSREIERELRLVHGQQFLSPEEAIQAMAWALGTNRAQTAVFRMDWEVFARQFPGGTSPMILRELVPARPASVRSGAPAATMATPPTPVVVDAQIHDILVRHVAAMLGEPAERVDLDKSLNELGMDSVLVLVLRGRLLDELGVPGSTLPLGQFLEDSSITRLAAAIADRRHSARPSPANPAEPAAPNSVPSPPESAFLDVVRAGAGRIPIVVVAHFGYIPLLLKQLLPADVPIWHLKHLDLGRPDLAGDSISEITSIYFTELVKANAPETMTLVGFSYAGLLAFDLACRLQESGRSPRVMLIEPSVPGIVLRKLGLLDQESPGIRLRRHIRALQNLEMRERYAYVAPRAANLVRILWDRSVGRIRRGYLSRRIAAGDSLHPKASMWYYWPRIERMPQDYTPWRRAVDVHVAGSAEWLQRYGPAWRTLVEGEMGEFVAVDAHDHAAIIRLPAAVASWAEPIRQWTLKSP